VEVYEIFEESGADVDGVSGLMNSTWGNGGLTFMVVLDECIDR
jgi:hypothetical protein